MLNIVIPMAGLGSRFKTAGYELPKPLIRVGGRPMIEWVIENIRPSRHHRFIFICLKEYLLLFPEVLHTIKAICPNSEFISINRVTEGAACTVLLARDLIDSNEPLMIANSDQYVDLNINEYLSEMEAQKADGLIMTFFSDHPKWSYCRLRSDGTVSEVVEKKVVSQKATVGIYNFKFGSDFVRSAESMINENLRVNGEFYVAPAYNKLIEAGAKVVTKDTGVEYGGMYGLGTPLDLDFFLTTDVFRHRAKSLGAPVTGLEWQTRAALVFLELLCQGSKDGANRLTLGDCRIASAGSNSGTYSLLTDCMGALLDRFKGCSFKSVSTHKLSQGVQVNFQLLRGGSTTPASCNFSFADGKICSIDFAM
jgi:dTDP-glucose pyrophosphorylase